MRNERQGTEFRHINRDELFHIRIRLSASGRQWSWCVIPQSEFTIDSGKLVKICSSISRIAPRSACAMRLRNAGCYLQQTPAECHRRVGRACPACACVCFQCVTSNPSPKTPTPDGGVHPIEQLRLMLRISCSSAPLPPNAVAMRAQKN